MTEFRERTLVRNDSASAAPVLVAILVAALAPTLGAQVDLARVYVGIEAGAVFDASQFSVRSSTGVSADVLAGRQFSDQAAGELRLGLEYFGRPTEFISPGCPPNGPCNPPIAEQVVLVALGADAVIGGHRRTLTPILLAGTGARYAHAQPGPSDLAPYAELGTGLQLPIGAAHFGVEIRYQIAMADLGLPTWTVPATAAIRF